jgi:hypothetical protein
MGTIYKVGLTVPQKEELLELLVKQSKGVVSRSPNGVLQYKFASSPLATFTGKEDIYQLSKERFFDWETEAASNTKLDGLATMQSWQKAFEAISESIQYAPRQKGRFGYVDLPLAVSQGLYAQGIILNVDNPLALWRGLLHSDNMQERLPETFSIPFDDNRRNPIVKDLLKSIESLGLQFYIPGDRIRLSKDIDESRRLDKEDPSLITEDGVFKQSVAEQAHRYVKANAGSLAFSKLVHRSCHNRNISIAGEGESASYPSEFMSPAVRRALMMTYKLAFKGLPVDATLNALSFKYAPLTKSITVPTRASTLEESVERRVSYIMGVVKIRAEQSSKVHPGSVNGISSFINVLSTKKTEMLSMAKTSDAGALTSKMEQLERWMSPSFYTANNAIREGYLVGINELAPIKTGAGREELITDIVALNKSVYQFSEVFKVKSPKHAIGMEGIESPIRNMTELPLGVSESQIRQAINSFKQDMLNVVGVEVDLETVNGWGFEEFTHQIDKVIAHWSQHDPAATLTAPQESREEADSLPDVSDMTHSSVSKEVSEIMGLPPTPSTLTISKDTSLGSPPSLGNALDSAILKDALSSLQDRLFDLPFDRNGELVLPDEMEWVQHQWNIIVGDLESVDVTRLSDVYNNAMTTFSPINHTKSRKKMTDWYLDNANLSLQRDRYEKTNNLFVNNVLIQLKAPERDLVVKLHRNYFSPITSESGTVPEHANGDLAESLVSKFTTGVELWNSTPQALTSLCAAHAELLSTMAQWQKMASEHDNVGNGFKYHLNEALSDVNVWNKSSVDKLVKKLNSAMDDKSVVKVMQGFDGDVELSRVYKSIDNVLHDKVADYLVITEYANELMQDADTPSLDGLSRKMEPS